MGSRLINVSCGVYRVSSVEVCSPDDILLDTINGALGNAGWEMIAEKILLFSKINGAWCGLSLNRLADELSKTMSDDQLAEKLSCIRPMEVIDYVKVVRIGGLVRRKVSIICPTAKLVSKLHGHAEHGLVEALAS